MQNRHCRMRPGKAQLAGMIAAQLAASKSDGLAFHLLEQLLPVPGLVLVISFTKPGKRLVAINRNEQDCWIKWTLAAMLLFVSVVTFSMARNFQSNANFHLQSAPSATGTFTNTPPPLVRRPTPS